MKASAPPTAGWLFAHSARDALLVALAALQLAAAVAGVALWSALPWPALLGLGAALVVLYPVNVNCVSHNFIHNRFFTWRPLNVVFSVFNSLAFGLPQTIYHWHHLNHHRWNNDAKRPDGTTRDLSSIYRYSRTDGPEHVLSYSLLSFFRVSFPALIRKARRHRMGPLLLAEALAVVTLLGALALLDWRGVVCFWLPTWYLGWSLSSTENYYEHWGADPRDRYANSVSSYGRLYNLLTFNNGYHMEHHWRPQVHWTRVPEVTAEFGETFRAHGLRVLRGPHITAFLEPPAPPAGAAP